MGIPSISRCSFPGHTIIVLLTGFINVNAINNAVNNAVKMLLII